MPHFDIIKKVEPKSSFRVASIMGKFDLQSSHIQERFAGDINLPDHWNIGLIVGKSGTGKTTIAKELFPESYVISFGYTGDTVLDDMPQRSTIDQITRAFNSVGFSSPPSWLKPYSVLSNGEKMRCDLARAILENKDMFVFDEFTSVVDRQVARIGSYAMQRAIRKENKKFIALSCHFDIQEWLMPDWVFNTDTMTFQSFEGQKKNKPAIKFEIFSTKDKGIWGMFAKYHYLSSDHNNAASVYVALANDEIAGFLSVFHFPHPKCDNIKKVHRLVVLPDYQGIGIGKIMLNEIGKIYKEKGFRFTISTSAPSLIFGLGKDKKWRCSFLGRKKAGINSILKRTSSQNRIIASFELI
jgi:GNAT superfamily N-acetyltransferase